jgi:hypothetical protein
LYEAAAAPALAPRDAALLAGLSPPWPGGRKVAGGGEEAGAEAAAAAAAAAADMLFSTPRPPKAPHRDARLPPTPSLEVATAEAQRRSVETRKLLGEADGKRAYVVRSHLHGMMRETPGKAWVRQALGLGVILSCLLAYLTLLGGRGQAM